LANGWRIPGQRATVLQLPANSFEQKAGMPQSAPSRPLYLQKRTQLGHHGMSEKGRRLMHRSKLETCSITHRRGPSREQHSDGECLCGFGVDDHHDLKRFKPGYKS
jgi:hypothetical protein